MKGRESCWLWDRETRLNGATWRSGLQSATDVEITSGLQENETIIFGSLGQYRPGEIVAPKLVEPSRME